MEALTREKLYIIAGPEFKHLEGHTLLVHKALYGLRTSGTRWAETLADYLTNLGWKQCQIDPAIWIMDKGTHYEYLIVWVDDILICLKDPMVMIAELKKRFTLKGVGKPEYFLGADMTFETEADGSKTFTMGSKTYVKRILKQFELVMGYKPKKVKTPLDPKDHPELDESELLDEKAKRIYWSLMGMLQWAITIGQMDIHIIVMTMGRFRMEPKKMHLERVERIFGFLQYYKSASIKFRIDMPGRKVTGSMFMES